MLLLTLLEPAGRVRIFPFKGNTAAVSSNLSPAFEFLCAAAITQPKPAFLFLFLIYDIAERGCFISDGTSQGWGGGRGPSPARELL